MANLHTTFLEYNRIMRLSDDKRNELIIARDGLRYRIEANFDAAKSGMNNDPERKSFIDELLEFQSQGSYVMDTIINPIHGDYDLDDGIYLIGKRPRGQRPEPEELHRLVIQAIGADPKTIEKVIDKNTCVRVIFKAGFHIDLPIYYAGDKKCPDLADKKRGYTLSNPVEFIAWFEQKINSGFRTEFLYETKLYRNEYRQWLTDIRKQDHQLRRIVRYLKSWGDLRREEMPCGLVMTILAANHYAPRDRDDVSLMETLVNIHAALSKNFRCDRPTTPKGENLLDEYKNKDAFMKYLKYFIDSAKAALQENDAKKACGYWQERLGNRFPCHLVQSTNTNTSANILSGLVSGASSNRPWGKAM
ncbi:MAG: hypothetical protein JNK20_00920 [Flavipsychrobacter sp.]|nr:hypothetical protein [Flavipsychrobacter sp.]